MMLRGSPWAKAAGLKTAPPKAGFRLHRYLAVGLPRSGLRLS